MWIGEKKRWDDAMHNVIFLTSTRFSLMISCNLVRHIVLISMQGVLYVYCCKIFFIWCWLTMTMAWIKLKTRAVPDPSSYFAWPLVSWDLDWLNSSEALTRKNSTVSLAGWIIFVAFYWNIFGGVRVAFVDFSP